MPRPRPPPRSFRELYVDDRIVVIDKRAGVLVHRTPTSKDPTLIDDLRRDYGFVHPIHRLDRFVSGVLVYAKDVEAAENLRAQFAQHGPDRRYLAVVQGQLTDEQGSFRSRLRLNPGNFRMISSGRGRRGALATTHWWQIEAYPEANASHVEVALETGVKNQIRVHFADAGHPLLGEQKYLPAGVAGARTTQRRRLFLHAAYLAVRHPDDSRVVEFEAPLPNDLLRWRAQLRRGLRDQPRSRSTKAAKA